MKALRMDALRDEDVIASSTDDLLKVLPVEKPEPSQARTVIESRLRSAIIGGQVKPGTRIKQESIAKHYGVSRMPVREALRQLEAQGYLIGAQHKGYTVSAATSSLATILRPLSEQYAHLGGEKARHDFETEVLRLIRNASAFKAPQAALHA